MFIPKSALSKNLVKSTFVFGTIFRYSRQSENSKHQIKKFGVQAQSTLSPPLLPSPLHSDIPDEPIDRQPFITGVKITANWGPKSKKGKNYCAKSNYGHAYEHTKNPKTFLYSKYFVVLL